MCICINCRHVHSCSTYQFIQKQHKQDLLQNKPFFLPVNTLIYININLSLYSSKFDWDLTECLSFIEQPGNWINKNFV